MSLDTDWGTTLCTELLQLNYSDTLSPKSQCMGGYEPSFSHPLYEPAERRHTEGAAGVQEAVACRCLITAETARSVAGQYPAGSGVLPASSTTQAQPHKPVVCVLLWFTFHMKVYLCCWQLFFFLKLVSKRIFEEMYFKCVYTLTFLKLFLHTFFANMSFPLQYMRHMSTCSQLDLPFFILVNEEW